MSLESLFEWGQQQIKYVLFLVLFGALIYTAYKRAWIALVGVVIGLAIVSIFVVNPEILIDIGDWASRMLKLGK